MSSSTESPAGQALARLQKVEESLVKSLRELGLDDQHAVGVVREMASL